MPVGEALEDDYVVSLLKRDAEGNKNRYLTSGLGSLLSSKPRNANAPKPNTRFLRNLIRETDSHNVALKAKEQDESRARAKGFRKEEAGGKRKRERDEHGEDSQRAEKRRSGDIRPHRWADALGGLGKQSERREAKVESESSRKDAEGSRPHDRRPSNRSPAAGHGHRSTVQAPLSSHQTGSPEHRKKRRRRTSNASESDPLEDLIGPSLPPTVHTRGRGAVSNSTMDARFGPDYDPKADVSVEPEEGDDWDMALEALRDRTKWRQQGAERLKAAGFTDEEVKTWETGDAGEKDVEDVRWRKRGEEKEWDRGKVMDGTGGAAQKADWVSRLDV
ncbi:hypothetical protein LTR08_001168 [Meristemomyces frigidus]|nr:hypothetical protein LTR08_001168 [Meristemomyces frigidus]